MKPEPTYRVTIRSSHERGNAPHGYLIAHVELIPGVLFAQSERNPFTNGEWRWVTLCLGDDEHREPIVDFQLGTQRDDSKGLGVYGSAVIERLREVLKAVSALYESKEAS